ncbi:carbohydrate-binding protein [Lactococcus lactis]
MTGLSKKTEYNVEIVAVDPSGNRSDTARATFMTLDTSAENNTWQKDKVYVQGDRVTFNGVNYEAKWWNTGQQPDQSGDFGPWKKL